MALASAQRPKSRSPSTDQHSVYLRGGRSIAGPAILHTSTNTPAIILALPEALMATVLVMHMGVILVSVYLVFLVRAGTPSASGKAALT